MDISTVQQGALQANTSNVSGRAYADVQRAAVQSSASEVDLSASKAEPARAEVEKAVASIQDFVQSARHNINFSLEDDTGRIVVKVTDAVSGDTIRQMPSEEALRLAESLSEARSLLFKTEV